MGFYYDDLCNDLLPYYVFLCVERYFSETKVEKKRVSNSFLEMLSEPYGSKISTRA